MPNVLTAGNKAFLDTNIFLYAQDQRDAAKRTRSRDLIAALHASGCGVVSTQTMQELFAVGIKKFAMSPHAAKALVHTLRAFETVQVTPSVIETAMDLVIVHHLSIWDALIVAAAASAGCRTLYSEDLQAGSTLLGVRVVNPLA